MKDFIPYEQALALKELGFDEPCLSLFHNDKSFYPTQCKSHEQYHGQVCSAPLYQQAFRWFRQKYRLTGLVEIGTQEYSFLIFDENTDSREITSSMNGAYEEAELACLIKLIEIVKKK